MAFDARELSGKKMRAAHRAALSASCHGDYHDSAAVTHTDEHT